MKKIFKKVTSLVVAATLVVSGLTYTNTKAADTNILNGKNNTTYLTSNANNGNEGFCYVGNGFTNINVCNENLTNGNNLLGKTATTDEVAVYVDLQGEFNINSAKVYQGSTNANYTDSYCTKYSIYYSTQEVNTTNKGNVTWNLAGTCNNGTIYQSAKIKEATNVSTTGDSITFADTYKAKSVKIVFDKNSCMGTGTNGNNTGTTGTVSLLSFRVFGSEATDSQEKLNILFIGNSFTYYNTSWEMFKGIAGLHGHDVNVTAATNGGKDLNYQATAENVLTEIKKGGYDIVILQDKVGSNFQKSTLESGASTIIPIIREYSPDCQLAFYEPWPITSQIEDKMSYFTSSYIDVAKQWGATLAPAGEGFYELYKKDNLNYYCSDERHPQPLGTFNSASTIYYSLFPEDAYTSYTESNHTALDTLINKCVAYTDEGKQDSYNLATLNKINAYAYKYAHAVIPAVKGTGTYTSVADGGVVPNPTESQTTQQATTAMQTTQQPTTQGNQNPEDILFIGNSMTYYNNLSKVVKGLAQRKGHNINTEAAVNGGQNLIYQSSANNVLTAIKKGGFEVVVLQDIVGGFNDVNLQNGAQEIVAIIKEYNPNAKIVFYEPWPTKDTISGNNSLLPYFTNSYIKTTKSLGATLAPAGEAFYELYTDDNLDFYCTDNKHPKPLGTFVSASTIYYTLYPEEEYGAFTSADQSYYDNLINTNVAYTDEGKQSSYSLDTLNKINAAGYKYAHAVSNAVAGNGKYTSVAGEYVDLDELYNPNNLPATQGVEVNSNLFSIASGDIAIGKSASASSGVASLGVNGKEGDRWESTHGVDPQWIYVDLGEKKNFDTVGFIWEGAYASKYYIQVSDNATDWETIAFVTATSKKTEQIDLGKTYNNRYVRMVGTKRGTQYGYSFYEMGIWNKSGETVTDATTQAQTTQRVTTQQATTQTQTTQRATTQQVTTQAQTTQRVTTQQATTQTQTTQRVTTQQVTTQAQTTQRTTTQQVTTQAQTTQQVTSQQIPGQEQTSGVEETSSQEQTSYNVVPTTNRETVTTASVTSIKVKIKKASIKKMKLKVSLKKIASAKGYVLIVAKKKNFKKKYVVLKKTFKSNKVLKKAVISVKSKKLKKAKKLFARVRACFIVNQKMVYGKWSNVKKVKIKS